MKLLHLRSVGVAIILLIVALAGGTVYARTVESRYVHALAPQLPPLNRLGSVLQMAAFQQTDLLFIYGSSELIDQAVPYGAAQFFGTYPTGFAPYIVADPAATSLIMAQSIASVGSEVRGRKVVISFTPSMFLDKMAIPEQYAGLFSRLHAYTFIFGTDVSIATKRLIAQRMLVYTDTLQNEPMLRFALQRLANDSPFDRVLYILVWPLGKLQTFVMNFQDHWATLNLIWNEQSLKPEMPRQRLAVNWTTLKLQAEREQVLHANNNALGFDNTIWTKYFQGSFTPKTPASGDLSFETSLDSSQEWADLEILMRVLTEMGTKPLLLSRPVNGAYWAAKGVSSDARDAYYEHLRALAQQYNMPVVDFKAQEMDKYFSVDTLSHTSRKGWVYVNQVLDAFFHNRLQ